MTRKTIEIASLLAASAALLGANQAQAQDTTIESIEEVVVTGQKIERSLQDTKESVVVLTGDMLDERGLTDLTQIIEQTAGVSGDRYNIRIRGISSPNGSQRSELSSVYVDGVALSGWVKSEGPGNTWDVQQVEILRGPQSTNLGRNALAGAIVTKTNDPSFDTEVAMGLTLGDYGTQELKGMANVVLSEGLAALRLTVEDNHSDGYINNTTLFQDDTGYLDNATYRGKLLLQPSDRLRAVLSYQHINNRYGESAISIEGRGFDPEDFISTNDIEESYELEADLASLIIDYDLSDSWTLTSITAFQDGARDRYSDTDKGPMDPSNGGGLNDRQYENTNWSQELRLNLDLGTLKGSSGVYFSNVESLTTQSLRSSLDLAQYIADEGDLIAPGAGELFASYLIGFGEYPNYFDLQSSGESTLESDTFAVFSEWDMQLSEKWKLSFGARYDSEKQEYSSESLTTSSSESFIATAPTVPNPGLDLDANGSVDAFDDYYWFALLGQFDMTLQALITSQPFSTTQTDFDAFLPHVGLSYQFSDNITTSFFVKEGYRSGGTEILALGATNSYDPEYLLNYEFSLRSQTTDGRAILNMNAYYGDWTDQQVSVPESFFGNAFFKIVNSGRSEIYGVELDASYILSDNISGYVSAAFTGTEYIDFVIDPASGENYNGNEFQNAPKNTGALGFNYSDGNWVANANVTYTGSFYGNAENTILLESITRLNARLGYEWDRLRVEAYVNNLTNEVSKRQMFGFTDDQGRYELGRTNAPRTYGARVFYRL
jgi:outer membrane receptor protein involved in Fe transport